MKFRLLLVAIFFLILPAPFVHANTYVEVVKGCYSLTGNCVNIRTGPGTQYGIVRTARIGTLLEVAQTIQGKDRVWYKIKQDPNLRYPERVSGNWYIAGDMVRARKAPGVLMSSTLISTNKKIIVDRSSQILYAYDGKKLFMTARISTGLAKTPTPLGTFRIFKKQPSRYMQGPLPFISEKKFDLPGVPWNLYFTQQGAAIHGTYWHAKFGTPASNGCVNMTVATAKKLYDWATVGTVVQVRQ
jgi:lipoprotein-anchoring transpeptidase ErfK/SrfK